MRGLGEAYFETEVGWLKLEHDQDVLVGLKHCNEPPLQLGRASAFADEVRQQVLDYLAGTRMSFDFAIQLKGTSFQQKVWAALCAIPYGETRTYKQMAEAIGNPKACRAVGSANNKNPMQIVVPCHRVVGAGNHLVGYAGGLVMKEHLLKLEGALGCS